MSTKPGKAERFEGVVLVLILLAVGGAAGAASFTHVHDWTMDNSPANTGDWFGWANAVITELVPIASALVMRRRRRVHPEASITYPMFLLLSAVVLSVTAQLAVAKPGFFGGLVSVIPALAFVGLTKLVTSVSHGRIKALAQKSAPTIPPIPAAVPAPVLVPPAPTPVPATVPVPDLVPAAVSTVDTTPTPDPEPVVPVVVATPADVAARVTPRPASRPGPDPVPAIRPAGRRAAGQATSTDKVPASTTDTSTVTASEPAQPTLPDVDLALLAQATRVAREHRTEHGTPITAGQLAVKLRVPTKAAAGLLAAIPTEPDPIRPTVNGHPVTVR